jgi:hypothetical protein
MMQFVKSPNILGKQEWSIIKGPDPLAIAPQQRYGVSRKKNSLVFARSRRADGSERNKGAASVSERVNQLLKRALEMKRKASLYEEAAEFFSTALNDREERRAFQRANLRTGRRMSPWMCGSNRLRAFRK